MKTRIAVLVGLVTLGLGVGTLSLSADAPAAPQGKVYGKIFADWYYDESNKSILNNSTPRSQFELGRVYLGYNYKIDDNFTADALLDVGRTNPGTSSTSTSTSTSTINAGHDSVKTITTTTTTLKADPRYYAFLKTAYLAWKNVLPFTTLSVGQIGYFAFDVEESFWGRRYIYSTFMDANSWESSADLGAKAVIAPDPSVKATVGITHGEGYKAPQDNNGNYKFAAALQYNPMKELTLYAYGDWMPVAHRGFFDTAQATISVFAGYQLPSVGKLGVELDGRQNDNGTVKHNKTGVSVNGSVNITKPFEVFGRCDIASSAGNWNGTGDGKFATGGLQYSPTKNVKFAADYQWALAKPKGSVASDRFYLNGEFDY